MISNEILEKISWAADAIKDSDALVFAAGAGMGVDSGLPDFRGNDGFWNAYPPYKKLGLSFVDLANPEWFTNDPTLAWGFYGHRLGLYRNTNPHTGYDLLLKWGNQKKYGYQVFTSNVDGAFRKAGFDNNKIVECHGRIDLAQCTKCCGVGIFSIDKENVKVDQQTFRATGLLPACNKCGAIARPNILMFYDFDWDSGVIDRQYNRMRNWLQLVAPTKVTIIECGAGVAVASVRKFCSNLLNTHNAKLVRINVRDYEVENANNQVGIPLGALEALTAIEQKMKLRYGFKKSTNHR